MLKSLHLYKCNASLNGWSGLELTSGVVVAGSSRHPRYLHLLNPFESQTSEPENDDPSETYVGTHGNHNGQERE